MQNLFEKETKKEHTPIWSSLHDSPQPIRQSNSTAHHYHHQTLFNNREYTLGRYLYKSDYLYCTYNIHFARIED